MITFKPSAKFDQEATVILLDKEQTQAKTHAFKNEILTKTLAELVQSEQFTGEHGEIYPLVIKGRPVILVGVGNGEKASLTGLRCIVRKVLISPFLKKVKSVELIPHTSEDSSIQAIMEGVLIGTYAWRKYKSKDQKDKTVFHKDVVLIAPSKKHYEDLLTICAGVNLTRDLVNDNADFVTSTYIEGVVKYLIKGNKNVTVEILNEKELKDKGLNLLLAVNQGSTKEPKVIIIQYHGGSPKDGYTAIVGKGLTFDTGGLNLKPTGHIETMRIDMSGAAAVIGIMSNVLSLKIKKNLIFAMGIAENAIGSRSFKPGDVITGYAGKSVEIGNTDAEGRLVLADTIAYIVKNYKPERIIDMATLTGACVVALGFDYSGLFSNNDEFAKHLIHSSRETDDRAWRLPIYPEIKEYIKSPIADIKNTSSIKGAGACTAAEFLHQFTEGTIWAHLDIAGSAFAEGQGRMYFAHGATGAGVRLVTHYLLHSGA